MMNKVVASLQKEYSRLEKEMGQVGKALDALGHSNGKRLKMTGRTLSKDARQPNCRSTKTTLGEGPKGRRQASEVISKEMLSQAPQPASFVTSQSCERGPSFGKVT